MTGAWKWFLATIAGLVLSLGGLFWDAVIHSREQGHAAEESLLNLSNPGHLVFGLGLVFAVLVALAGFTVGWMWERRPGPAWQAPSVPAGLWLAVGLVGLITFAALRQAG